MEIFCSQERCPFCVEHICRVPYAIGREPHGLKLKESSLNREEVFHGCEEFAPLTAGYIGITSYGNVGIVIPLGNGNVIEAEASSDADFPGVDISITDDASDDTDFTHTEPRVLVEWPLAGWPVEGTKPRVLVWADPDSEDYTHRINF